jgi:hypothetical protein
MFKINRKFELSGIQHKANITNRGIDEPNRLFAKGEPCVVDHSKHCAEDGGGCGCAGYQLETAASLLKRKISVCIIFIGRKLGIEIRTYSDHVVRAESRNQFI